MRKHFLLPSLIIITTLTLPKNSFGQETTTALPQKNLSPAAVEENKIEQPTSTEDHNLILGFIQFVDGDVKWKNQLKINKANVKTQKQEPKYQGLIHGNESLNLSEGSLLKIISDELCTGVLYGPGTATAPNALGKAWQINTAAVRWICPTGKKQTLSIKNKEILIDGGEFVLQENKLLTKKNLVQSSDNQFDKDKIYNALTSEALEPQPSKFSTWKFDNSLKKPQESLALKAPIRRYKKKLIFSFGTGGGSLSHDDDIFDSKDIENMSLDIQYQTKWKTNKSLIFGLGITEFFDNNDNNGFSSSSETTVFSLDAGIRWNHERSWSFYTRAGLGFGTLDARAPDPNNLGNGDINFRAKQNYAMIRLGIEKIFLQDKIDSWDLKGWHGIYANAEISIIKSLTSSFKSTQNTGNTAQAQTAAEKGILGAAILVNIGIPFGLDEG